MEVSDSSAEHLRNTGHLPLADQFHLALNKYAEINPGYEAATDPSAYQNAYQRLHPDLRQELQDLFIDPKTGETRSEQEILRNLDIIITSLVSRVEQVETLGVPRNSDKKSKEDIQAFFEVVKSILSHPLDRQQEVVIDPRRITDTLLRNLGLSQFIPAKGTSQADKAARREEAVHSIKAMLPHLEPINAPGQRPTAMRHFRLMRMTAGSSEGYVLGTQTINNKKILFKSDLHGASRRVQHIEAGYKEEIGTLGKIQKILENALANPVEWENLDAKVLAGIRTNLLLCINDLGNVTNEEKIALRDAIKTALTFRKVGGAENPDVKANLKIALDELAARVRGIEGISQFLTSDKIKLEAMISAQTKPLEEFLAKVSGMHQSFKLLRPQVPIHPDKKEEIVNNLKELKKFADGQKFEPYLSFGRKFSAEIDKVLIALESGDRVSVAQEFVKAYLIAKLEKAYKDILGVYEKISLHPDLVNPQDISSELKEIHEALRNHEVAPGINTNEYDAAFIEVYHLLNSLKKRLREITPPEKQKPQLTFDFNAPRQASNPKPAENSRNRIDQILDIVEKIPKIGQIVGEMRALFNLLFKVEKPAARRPSPQAVAPEQPRSPATPAPAPKKIITKQKAYATMKDSVTKFDFRALAQNLPA